MQITIPATPVPVKSYPMKSSFENMAAKAIRVVCKVATHRPIIKQKNIINKYAWLDIDISGIIRIAIILNAKII